MEPPLPLFTDCPFFALLLFLSLSLVLAVNNICGTLELLMKATQSSPRRQKQQQ